MQKSRSANFLILNGALVALIGLIAGVGLLFEVLDAVAIWPFFVELPSGFPGTQTGWQLAHVAGLMNGMLMIVCALAIGFLEIEGLRRRLIVWCMVYTGWGNTLFFHFANFSANRALALEPSKLGTVDTAGAIGYFFGATTIPCTLLAVLILAFAAYRRTFRSG